MNLVEKVEFVASTMEIEEGQTNFTYFTEGLYGVFKNDSDLPIIEEKMNNLVNLMTVMQKEGKLDELLEKDFETEIWQLI